MKKGEKFKFTKGEFDNVFTCGQLLGPPTKPIKFSSENRFCRKCKFLD